MSNLSRTETQVEGINADSRKDEKFKFFSTKKRTKCFDSWGALGTSNRLVTNMGSKKTVAPKLKRKRIIGQYFLDLGQKNFSYSTCPVCGLFYARGLEGDESVHRVFHKNRTRGILFNGWQDERLVSKVDDKGNRVILVLPEDTHHRNKVKEVMAVVEAELGLSPGWLIEKACKVYLFISNSRKVVGCLMAEPINTAFKVLPSKKQVPDRQGSMSSVTLCEHSSGCEATTSTTDASLTEPRITSEQKIDELAGDGSENLADVPGVSEVSLQAGNRNITTRRSGIVKECRMSDNPNAWGEAKTGAGVSSSPIETGTGVSTKSRTRKITEFFEPLSTPAGVGKENASSNSELAWPLNSVPSLHSRRSKEDGLMPSSSGRVQVVLKEEVVSKAELEAVQKEHPDGDGDDLSVDASVQKKPFKQVTVGENYILFGNVKLKREVMPRKRAREEELGSAITYNTTPISAVCGVRVIWVCNSERRKGIASHLLDAMRKTFCFGVVLEISQFAFSQPSTDGRKFAARYCRTDEFLVYTTS